MGEGLGVGVHRVGVHGVGVQSLADSIQRLRQVVFDHFCGNPHESQTQRLQQFLTPFIRFALMFVDSSVNLDDQPLRMGVEVDDEGTDGLLPPKLDAFQFLAP
jgi:hypothetical protein